MSDIENETPRGLSQLLIDFENALSGERTSVRDMLTALHERGFGALLFIFALPAALPLPVPPGINLIIALPLIILTFQQLLGRANVWLPEGVKKRSVDTKKLMDMLGAATPWIKKLERIVKPRFGVITQGLSSRLIGVCGFIMALSVCVPIPLSNTVPSFAIALMAIGVLMRDGLAVIVGAIIGLLWVVILYSLLIYFGLEGIEMVKDFIKSALL